MEAGDFVFQLIRLGNELQESYLVQLLPLADKFTRWYMQ